MDLTVGLVAHYHRLQSNHHHNDGKVNLLRQSGHRLNDTSCCLAGASQLRQSVCDDLLGLQWPSTLRIC